MVNLMEVCGEGHDLTLPNAYIYVSGGNRACRVCTIATRGKKIKPTKATQN